MTRDRVKNNEGINRGIFVSFEGEDGCGKTTIIEEVSSRLISDGYNVQVINEFSDSFVGNYLKRCLEQDKFLRRKKEHRTALTQTFAVLTNYVFLLENQIIPGLENNDFVLKDRAIDTIVSCQISHILEQYNIRRDVLYRWFYEVLKILPLFPDLTIYLDVPVSKRIKRIKRRERDFAEERSNEVSEEDLIVFEDRDKIHKILIQLNKNRIVKFNNDISLDEAVKQIVGIILGFREERNKFSLQGGL